MKYLMLVIILFISLHCGKNPAPQPNTTYLTVTPNCVASPVPEGTLIKCDNGTSSIIKNGVDGQSIVGPAGQNGKDGIGLVSTTVSANQQQCPGSTGTIIIIAQDTLVTGVYSTQDAGQQMTVVCNGIQGQQGVAGQNGVSPSQPLAPISTIATCGSASSPYKEILLCLSNGQLLADFSDNASGANTRLTFIPTGSYQNTDNSGCNFNVIQDLQGNTMVSWGAGSNTYSTWVSGTQVCLNTQGN